MRQIDIFDKVGRVLVLMFFFVLMVVGVVVVEDFCMFVIWVVFEKMWDVVLMVVWVEFVNNVDYKKFVDFIEKMGGWVVKVFGKFDYIVSEDVDIIFLFIVDQFDFGFVVVCFVVGFGVGKLFVLGMVIVCQGDKVFGFYCYFVCLGGVGVKFMLKEVGFVFVLQIYNCEVDEKLYEYKKGKKKNKEEIED